MLAVIVPALDSARTLGACLGSVAGADERIVVDGGSADATIEVARAAGAKLIVTQKGRGVQLSAGAQTAAADWLLFLHSDTWLVPGWQDEAERHMAQSPHRPACFRLRLDAHEWQARVVEKAVALRTRRLGLPYGDQGLLLPRWLYRRSGGYRPLPLMEDVDLVRRLPPVALLEADAVTSAERWRRDGWLRRSARNLACVALWRAGVSEERIARLYG